jgi:hypothetical protein
MENEKEKEKDKEVKNDLAHNVHTEHALVEEEKVYEESINDSMGIHNENSPFLNQVRIGK